MIFKRSGGTRPKRAYRVFFATDVHGSDRCFRKFLNAAAVYEADALLLGGDVAGKAIVPLVEHGNGYRINKGGREQSVSREELDTVCRNLTDNGLYPHPCSPGEFEKLREDRDYRSSLFTEMMVNQLASWCELAGERLPAQVRCIITPGNDDPLALDETLREASRVECPEREVIELGPVSLASLGNVNRTPWDTDREFDEDELGRQIDEMLAPLQDGPLMLNFHCPPYDSGLDTATKLDETLAPVLDGGTPVEIPVGSTAVRDAVLRYQPGVGLHGHIHEARGVQRLGATVCINPGSDYASGTLMGAIVDLDEAGGYVNHLLTAG